MPHRCFRIISEAAQGRTAHENVDELQDFIRRTPQASLPEARAQVPAGAGEAMLGRWRQGLAQGHEVPVGLPSYEAVATGQVVMGTVA